MTGHVEEFSTDLSWISFCDSGCDVRVMVNRKKRGAKAR